jgi:hypothetical protein
MRKDFERERETELRHLWWLTEFVDLHLKEKKTLSHHHLVRRHPLFGDS